MIGSNYISLADKDTNCVKADNNIYKFVEDIVSVDNIDNSKNNIHEDDSTSVTMYRRINVLSRTEKFFILDVIFDVL